jgi:hypothetical protein
LFRLFLENVVLIPTFTEKILKTLNTVTENRQAHHIYPNHCFFARPTSSPQEKEQKMVQREV